MFTKVYLYDKCKEEKTSQNIIQNIMINENINNGIHILVTIVAIDDNETLPASKPMG